MKQKGIIKREWREGVAEGGGGGGLRGSVQEALLFMASRDSLWFKLVYGALCRVTMTGLIHIKVSDSCLPSVFLLQASVPCPCRASLAPCPPALAGWSRCSVSMTVVLLAFRPLNCPCNGTALLFALLLLLGGHAALSV